MTIKPEVRSLKNWGLNLALPLVPLLTAGSLALAEMPARDSGTSKDKAVQQPQEKKVAGELAKITEIDVDSIFKKFAAKPSLEATAEVLVKLHGIPTEVTEQGGLALKVVYNNNYGKLVINSVRAKRLQDTFVQVNKFLPKDKTKSEERAMELVVNSLAVSGIVNEPRAVGESFTKIQPSKKEISTAFQECKAIMAKLVELKLLERTLNGNWKFSKEVDTKLQDVSPVEIQFTENPKAITLIYNLFDSSGRRYSRKQDLDITKVHARLGIAMSFVPDLAQLLRSEPQFKAVIGNDINTFDYGVTCFTSVFDQSRKTIP